MKDLTALSSERNFAGLKFELSKLVTKQSENVTAEKLRNGENVKFPEIYRSAHPLKFEHKAGDNFGWFMIPYGGKLIAVQADAQTEWEHVSASMGNRCPNWEEMCFIKSLFWDDEECVVQYHPPKSDYVNMAKTCLHLWKYKGEMPRPPKIMVGY